MIRHRTLQTTATMFLLAVAAHAQPSLTAPATVIPQGTTGRVDIAVGNAPAADNITGVDLFLRYDRDVATATNVLIAGTATDGWNIAYNIVQDVAPGNVDEIRISMASSTALDVPASGTLLQIEFSVVGATAPTSTSLEFNLAELNETAVTTTDGAIVIGGTTATVSLTPASVAVGGDLTLTVVDPDLAGQTGLTATVLNTSNGDTETVSLTEGTAGTFTGTITTAYAISGASGNSLLGVQAGDVVTASFDDPFDANGGAQTVSTAPGDLTVTGGSTATISLSPASVDPGDSITVTVVDADLAGQGPLTATIRNDDTGDTETVSLTEGVAGTFAGTIATTYDSSAVGTSGNDQLGVEAGVGVSAFFEDLFDASGGPQTVSTAPGELTVAGGTTATISLSPASVDPGGDITVTVVDADLAGQGPLTATIRNDSTGDTEVVALTEGSAGTFTATVTTEFATVGNSGNVLLGVQAGDAVSASFDDPFDVTGGPQTVGTPPGSLTINGGTTATLALSPSTLSPGDDITITVVDPDRVGQGPLTATIINTTSGDTETVTLNEAASPPAAAGTFVGSITTSFDSSAVGTSGNGLLGIAPGHTLSATYLDPFNDQGGSETIAPAPGNQLTILGGTTGTLSASAGVQAGGSFRIEVVDPDLNSDPLTVESVQVTVRNLSAGGGDTETVTLTETGVDTDIFRITPGLPTSTASAPGDGVLQVSPLDDVETEYVDALDDGGGSTTVTVTSSGTLWGDTSKNGRVGALDASLILQENVAAVVFDAYQSLVGDVSDPGAGAIPLNGFDAVLILRYAVGLETSFPDVESGTPVHPYKRVGIARRLAFGEPDVVEGRVRLTLVASEVEDLLAGNLTLGFDPTRIRIAAVAGSELTQDYMIASRVEGSRIRIAFAGTQSRGRGQGSILDITVESLGADLSGTPLLTIEDASLNGGWAPVEVVDSPSALTRPQVYSLEQNWPNPFNPETQIRYRLPQDTQVRLRIFDISGQTVATLVHAMQTAGDYTVRWDAHNDAGRNVASGIYFYRLDAGSVTLTRKMSLLR